MEGVRELYDPDAVMEAAPDWPEPGPFVGRDAVMRSSTRRGVPSTMIPPSFSVTSSPWAIG